MILEQIYDGNISPAEMQTKPNFQSKCYSVQADELEERLLKRLDEEGTKLFREWKDAEIASNMAKDAGIFTLGFRIAALMMAEVFI